MNEEVLLVRACGDSRVAHDKVTKLRLEPSAMSSVARNTLVAIGEFYSRDNAAAGVSWPIIKTRVYANSGGTKKQDDTIEGFFSEVENVAEEISQDNLLSALMAVRKRKLREDLLMALASRGAPNEKELLEEYLELRDAETVSVQDAHGQDEESGVFCGADILSYNTQDDSASRISVPILSMAKALGGGPKRKNHMLILARPEAGKTAFCITLVSGFIKEGHKVLYITNEEVPEDYIIRLMCCVVGRKEEIIRGNWDKAVSAALARGYGNLVLASLCPGTPKEIEDLVKEYEPDVLIVDQIRNLNMGSTSRVENLEDAGKFMRNMARRYNMLAVSVTQAGDSADNRLVLTMGDCDHSNTGLPGSTCIMVGLGVNSDYMATNRRVISFIKNKVTGDHGNYTVRIIPELSRIED